MVVPVTFTAKSGKTDRKSVNLSTKTTKGELKLNIN